MEWVFLATILVLGIVTAFVTVRQAVISEFVELSQSVMALSQSYSFAGQSSCLTSTAGTQAIDTTANTINVGSTNAEMPAPVNQSPCD